MLVIKKDLLNCSKCIIFNLNGLYPDPEVYDGSVPTVTIFFHFDFISFNYFSAIGKNIVLLKLR